ncbi:MAG: hypothetical protein J6J60_00480 [Clostridia bacterium]|nr:hypothetical protein [Clostridia bacterium]
MKKSKSSIIGSIIALLLTLLFAWILNYLVLPAITLKSVGFWLYLLGVSLFGIMFFAIPAYESEEGQIGKIGFVFTTIVACIIILALVIGGISSAKIFSSDKYQQIADVEVKEFNEDFQDIVTNDIPVATIDVGTAQKVGDRTIGKLEHASWFEVDSEFNLIKYQGEYYRLSPLNYGGLFKYNRAKKDGLPGYILVNSKTSEAKFIEVDGGYEYSPSAYFSKDLKRHLRSQYSNYILGKSFLEIDEAGKPYWVTAVKEPTIGFWGGIVEKRFIITDAKTGASEEYTLDNIPEWIDHAFSLDYLMETTRWHYEYINGFWNFSKTGVYRTSYEYRDSGEESGEFYAGYNSIINKDGDICFYAGLTPANIAESNVGFILINTRTGKVTQYDCSGAEESSAQEAAEGLVQNLGYKATFPTVLNIGGEETYLMCLKDKAGLIQRYALCNIENYAIVVESDSLENAIQEYLSKLGKNVDLVDSNNKQKAEIKGKILDIYTAQIDGTTYFYYLMEDNNLYKSSIKTNEMQILLRKDSEVTIDYEVSDGIRNVLNLKF